MKKLKGRPPSKITGRLPTSGDAPWWVSVASSLTGPGGLVGMTLTIDELTERVPDYPDGRRPRPRAVARRLRPILELIERGPNGSLGKGATYIVKQLQQAQDDVGPDPIEPDMDWLEEAVEKMTMAMTTKRKDS